MAAEFPFGTHFAGHASYFRGERTELIDHRIDGVLELQNFALHVHGDLLGKVAGSHGFGHVGNIAHLGRQVAGHEVHGVGQVFPGSSNPLHFSLPTEFSFGTDFAGHAGHFSRERAKLIDHRIDGVLQLQNFSLHIHGNLA